MRLTEAAQLTLSKRFTKFPCDLRSGKRTAVQEVLASISEIRTAVRNAPPSAAAVNNRTVVKAYIPIARAISIFWISTVPPAYRLKGASR